MPTISLLKFGRSGRYDDYGAEMLDPDRPTRYAFGPTNEEQVTDIFAHVVLQGAIRPLSYSMEVPR